MKERIQSLLREKNLSAVKLAEILEVQPSSISHLISGRNNPNFDFIAKVLTRFPEIDPDWFVLGKGKMFRESSESVISEKELSLPAFDRDLFSPPPAAPRKGGETPRDREKSVEKIILLYSDRTFSVYDG
jgi:transcriptional regulator with XRE-family HTH domain